VQALASGGKSLLLDYGEENLKLTRTPPHPAQWRITRHAFFGVPGTNGYIGSHIPQ
jgi:hypothetical protein